MLKFNVDSKNAIKFEKAFLVYIHKFSLLNLAQNDEKVG